MQIAKPIKQIQEFPSKEAYDEKHNKNANKIKFSNPVKTLDGIS